MKWSFLLRLAQEKKTGGDFYDFVPYIYGPFSFSLCYEIGVLVREGMLTEPDDRSWSLTAAGRKGAESFSGKLKESAAATMEKYGRWTETALLDSVYERFPWYTLNSNRVGKRCAKRPIASPSIFTMGYEGLSVDDFFNRLIRIGVRRIIDVRRNPVSRRFGFHKGTLERMGDKLGIAYVHFPELGIPSEERQALNSREDYVRLFHHYREENLSSARDKVQEVASLQAEEASVLLCAEADPDRCHRTVLAEAVSKINDLPVLHLGWPR